MAAVTDTDSMHENMTRIRMKMVQQKLANEREKLQRPESSESSNNGGQIKLQQAMIRRQELLDKIRIEQVQEEPRPRSYSPRRRYTPSSLPPPSRRSLPELSRGLSRAYCFNWFNKEPKQDMALTKHVIEHQFRPAEPATHRTYVLPPICQAPPPPPPPPQITTIQTPPVIQQVPSVTYVDNGIVKTKDPSFNKADFMDMMMMQNAQMHHMVMQQMMLHQLPGGGVWKYPTAQVPMAPFVEPMRPAYASAPAAPPVVHHYQSLPPLDIRGPPVPTRAYNSNPTFYDDGSNYYTYH